MAHYMVDLETMGINPDAPITSIGVVEFDADGLYRTFYMRVDLSSSVEIGGVIDPKTVIWWLSQDRAAQKEMTEGVHIMLALGALSEFLTLEDDDPIIWGCGAAFDNVILSETYDRAGIERPWNFRNDRCYRTMKSLFHDVPMDRSGTHHNALDDAKSQAMHLIKICKEKGVYL